jgi:2-oxo-hept-3-ene-1,7-dioate hydratase
MLDEKTIRSLAAGIEQARKTHKLIRPVTAQFPEATIEDAYAIQRASGSPRGTACWATRSA